MPLSDIRCRNAKPRATSYKLADGGGMYLKVMPSGAQYWRMDFRFAGKRRTLAIGVYPIVTLAQARARRNEAHALIANNLDPVVEKRAAKRTVRIASTNTFEALAREWLDKQKNRLSPKYRTQLLVRLSSDLFPRLGSRPVSEIDAPELLDALRTTERRGALETARRLRQTCGQIFRYAVATGRAKRDPSADLRGALEAPRRVERHKALLKQDLSSFLASLSCYDGAPRTRLALRLMLLTFVRTNELRAARWSEFENLDVRDPVWRIPADRMKMKVEHVVPLAPQAVSVLHELRALPGSASSPLLFPSPAREGYMSNNTMLFALYRMGYRGRTTVHGFRAMASTALNEMGFRPDVIERQLAHDERNKVRAAYNRAEYLAERRVMMNQWADYLDAAAGGKVVALKARASASER